MGQDHQNWTLFVSDPGTAFDLAKVAGHRQGSAVIQRDNTAVVQSAKASFHRMRPWAADPTLRGCVSVQGRSQQLLSQRARRCGLRSWRTPGLSDPAKAQAILARAGDYAFSRQVCEMHFPSDTAAGQALATAFTLAMLHSPTMQVDLEAARAELKAAGF